MSTSTLQFTNWEDVLNHKARILYAQIAEVQRGVAEQGGDAAVVEALCEPYYDLLKSMYAEDYPLAKAIETSDLLLSLEGPAINRDSPKISVIAGVFSRVRVQVTKLAKAVANLTEKGTPQEVELGLSAFAKGSLILGFTLPTTEEISKQSGQASLFSEQYFDAARKAIRTIGLVTQHVTEGKPLDELSELVPDVRIRDTVLNVVKELSPPQRSGIQSVRISGRELRDLELDQPLTAVTREEVSRRLERPITTGEAQPLQPVTIVGDVREMDLDTRRFDLRHIENMELNDLRCSYLDVTDEEAKAWLNQTVRVTGIVERDRSGKAQLLEITAPVEVL